MMMFFRRFGSKLSEFIASEPYGNQDPRVSPWDLGNEDFNYILRHSKKMRIINPDELADMRNVAELRALTTPNIRLLLPYGDHMVALEHKNNSYAYPYVIVSERERDCRLFIFETVQDLMSWMCGLKIGNDFDKWNLNFLNKMRIVRLMLQSGEVLIEGSTANNDITIDTTGWSKPGTNSALTKIITSPLLDVCEASIILKPRLLMLVSKPAFILDHNGYFIKDWRYNGK